MQRLLSANPDWCITGIEGTTGFVTDNLQLTMLGIVQAQHPDVADYSVPPHHVPTQLPTQLGQVLWDDDYSQILGHHIQQHQTLRLTESERFQKSNGFLRSHLMPHGALIWAKDVTEHTALRRLTGYIVSSEKEAKRCLYGVIAEYDATEDLAPRAVGVEKTAAAGSDVKPTELFESFDIDGPGGEVVTELEIPWETYKTYTMALKVRFICCLGGVTSFTVGAASMTNARTFKRFTPAGAGPAGGARQMWSGGIRSRRHLARHLSVSS